MKKKLKGFLPYLAVLFIVIIFIDMSSAIGKFN